MIAEEGTVTIREVNTNGGKDRKEINNCNFDGRKHRSTGGVRALNPQQGSRGQARDGQSDHRQQIDGIARKSQQIGNANITGNAKHHGRMCGGGALGSLHVAQGVNGAGQTGRKQAGTSGVRDVEVITLDDFESDGEILEEEAELIRLIQRRIGRKRSHVF